MKEDYKRYEPIFGAWHITEEIGSGAEGSLYRIRRTDSLGNEFYSALKAITIPAGGELELESLMTGGVTREEAEKYFENVLENTTHEFELLARLKGNSHIVSYEDHEIFRHETGFGWDILIRLEELVPLVKHSLDDPLTEADVLSMGSDICRGLVLCSRYGIVHRDIKPDNIFISPSGNYKLGDFGIARIVEQTTQALSRKGTYAYMAPEVYWGKDYDQRVDIYSLGLVMYRYLNDGRMPFMPAYPGEIRPGDGEDAFVKRINGHAMPAPRHGSDGLKRLVLRACAYDRDDRYSDAGEMLRDIEAIQAGKLPPESGRSKIKNNSAENQQTKQERKRKAGIAAAVLAACTLIAGVIYALIPKEITDINASEIDGGAELYIGDEMTPSYTVEPDWFKDEAISFRSGDENVFTVDESGRIHAVSVGSAPLTMSAKEYSEDVMINVVSKVTSIEGIDETVELTTGGSVKLEPRLEPEQFSSEPITYTIADEGIATVSDSGDISAVAAGETTITIAAGGCTVTRNIIVSEPVVYRSYSKSSGSSKSSGKSSGSSGSGSKGYFSSGDDEHF